VRDRVFPAVRRAIVTHRLLEPGEGVVVAVSGGADSVVLLHCLLRLRADWSLTLHVAHFDHGLREGSHRDARFVEELATSWDVPVTTDAWTREGGPKRSLQAEARRARYRFLGEVAAGLGAAKIALAHHRDDQAETVLLHLLRGSGLRGLRGMLPLRDGRLIRPLLQVGREEIERYAKAYRLSFVEDPSNRDLRYLRNRLRWNLMPVLRREYNPSLPRTLARMAAVVAEEEAYLAERAREAFEALAKVEGTRVCLDLASLRALAPALRRRVIERAVRLCETKGLLALLWMTSITHGWILAWSGRCAEALQVLDRGITFQEGTERKFFVPLTYAAAAEAFLLGGRPEEARRAADRALELALETGERPREALALHVLGEIAAAQRPPDDRAAAAFLERAGALAAELDMRPLLALCRLNLARVRRRTGGREQAEEDLRVARAMFAEMDMRFWLEQTEAERAGGAA